MKKQFEMKKKTEIMIMVQTLIIAAVVIVLNDVASAFTAPTSGSFAYDIYDIAVNKILKGPIGFVGGVGAICMGSIMAIRSQIMPAIPAILGGAALLKADTITASLGALI